MKKLFLVLLVLIILGVFYLSIEGRKVQEITTEINISAPPSKVWGILENIDSWKDWNPTINASSGTASVGSKLDITMMSDEVGKDGPNYSPVITALTKPSYFHWRAHMMSEFMFTNEKIIKLEETSSGTHLIHTETFSGLLTPLFRGKMEEGVPPILDAMNKALKDQAEK